MYELIIVIYLLVALGLIGLILIQQGKGADMGASFGAGSSATLFGSSGAGNFLTRSTAILAASFFILSLIIGNMTNQHVKQSKEWENLSEGTPAVVAEEVVPVEEPVNETDVPN